MLKTLITIITILSIVHAYAESVFTRKDCSHRKNTLSYNVTCEHALYNKNILDTKIEFTTR